MARENCTLYKDKFITDCNENCYGCCNRLYDKYVKPNASTVDYVDWNHRIKHGCSIYFTNNRVAEQAIEDVVKPFMEEHPEFVW